MLHPNVRNYTVSVSSEDEDPFIFGPYTERRARELADLFNQRIDREQHGWIHATALRIANPGIRDMLREFGQ